LSVLLSGCAHMGSAAKSPETPVRPVTEEIQGVKITDPYLWLEDAANPEAQKWTERQASHARSALDRLPHLGEIASKLEEWNVPVQRARDGVVIGTSSRSRRAAVSRYSLSVRSS